ncbi:MAG TPA: hypothetical protein VJ927_03280 [Actinomycetota bacterium]|nr:hypothetical protein [Actinomycetota bacterium]
MRKRLAMLVMSLSVVGLLIPAAPASASSCYIGDPGVDDVACLVFNEPAVKALCNKLVVC